jgi:tRNA (cmo5U34)-methyltransferase
MDIQNISERFDLIAQKYDSQRRCFIPCFDDFYGTSVSFLSTLKTDFTSILDLGAGTGLLTKYLCDQFPNAKYTLVDVAEQMMGVARERFSSRGNFTYIISDYSKELPAGNYDLIASALSIHHLDDQTKINLYQSIYTLLPQHGIFINLDQFNATSTYMNNFYVKWWHNYIETHLPSENEDNQWIKRRALDKENTIPESIENLKKIGFTQVECMYNFMKFGVILAIK